MAQEANAIAALSLQQRQPLTSEFGNHYSFTTIDESIDESIDKTSPLRLVPQKIIPVFEIKRRRNVKIRGRESDGDRPSVWAQPRYCNKEIGSMLKRIAATAVILLSLILTSCSISATSGLKSHVDTNKGYQFLYPNGWVPVKVSNGPDVVYHDLIQTTENVSVVISPVTDGKTLSELGSPTEVGYKLSKNAIAPPNSGREAELVNAEAIDKGSHTYYLLEYAVKLPTQQRHDFASVAISRGKLFTFNLSTRADRWEKLKDQFKTVVASFSVY